MEMGKRFTDTNKYKKPFYRQLPGAYKLLWDFLYHDCDHAGIWIVDFTIAQIYVGEDMPVEKQKALELFNKGEQRIVELEDSGKWFIPSFIEFQYVKLSPTNRAHQSVIDLLARYNLIDEQMQIKGLTRALDGPMVKAMVKEQVKVKEIQAKTEFELAVDAFVEMRKKIRKPITEHGLDLIKKELRKFSKGDEAYEIACLNKSTQNSWKGVFPLKEWNPAQPQENKFNDQQTFFGNK